METSNQKYYRISAAVDTPETGRAYPALMTVDDYDFNGPRSVHKLKHNEFPDFEPDLRFKLANGAKLCDVMSEAAISGTGLIVSEKFKDIICQHYVVPHKFHSVIIYANGIENHDYSWFQPVWDERLDYLKWEDSLFSIKKFSKVEGQISLNSYQEYLKKSKDLGFIKMIVGQKLKLHPIPFELFLIPFGIEILINDLLMQKIIDKGITGIKLKFQSNLYL